jgi:hypothetical protein
MAAQTPSMCGANGDFEFQAEPPEIGAPDGRSGSMHAAGEHDTGDRMVDPAKRLHRSRRQSDLVAGGLAVFFAEQRDVFLLDIIGVRDHSGFVRRAKRPEFRVGFVFCEQQVGCAPRGDILHRFSPLFRKA